MAGWLHCGLTHQRAKKTAESAFRKHTFIAASSIRRIRDQVFYPCASLPIHGLISGMNYWLVKSEPEAYAWAQLVKDGRTAWTGVRNFQARNNLRAMKKGDHVFFYHSVSDKQVVGLARVAKEFYPDTTAEEGDWSCVDLEPVKPLKARVTLATIKTDAVLKDLPLLKQSRLSVTPLTQPQAERILKLAGG